MLQQLRWSEYTTDNREVTGSIPVWSTNISGCSSVWLERVIWDHEAAGSSPVIRTIKDTYSNPSIRRLWVQIPWKAPFSFFGGNGLRV